MAQTQVVITGVDRTRAAMESVARNMKSIERTAKMTAKAVNLAFGFFRRNYRNSRFPEDFGSREENRRRRKVDTKTQRSVE